MTAFENAIRTLENYGLTDVLLPFLLIFTIIFAILQKMNLFGQGKKNFNVVVALVMSLTVVVPHVTGRYPPGADVVEIMNKALPQVSLIVILLVMVLITIGLWGVELKWAGTGMQGFFAIAMFATVVYIFGHAAGWFRYMPAWLSDPNTQALIIILAVFGLIVMWITRDNSKADEGVGKIGEGFAKLFGK